MNLQTVTFSFQIFCYDLLSQKKLTQDEILEMAYGFVNTADALDTTQAIIVEVLSKYNGRTIRVQDTFATATIGPSFDAVTEEGDSGVCGWLGSVSFEMNTHAAKC